MKMTLPVSLDTRDEKLLSSISCPGTENHFLKFKEIEKYTSKNFTIGLSTKNFMLCITVQSYIIKIGVRTKMER